MLDDDDVELTALTWPIGGVILTIIGIVVIVVMLMTVTANRSECEKKQCERGSPVLMHHECLCVEKAAE